MESKEINSSVIRAKQVFLEWCHFLFGHFWKAFLWGVFFISIAKGYEAFWGKFFYGFFKELGVAFVIGSIISIGIEEASRKEQNESVKNKMDEVSKNVIEAVYNRRFPDSVFEHIENNIIEKPYMKKDIVVEIILNKLSEEQATEGKAIAIDTPIIVCIKSSYTIINITNSAVKYPAQVFVETPWESQYLAHCSITRYSVNKEVKSEEELKRAHRRKDDDDDFVRYQFEDIELAPQESASIELEYQYVKYGRDATTWQSIHSAENARLSIVYNAKELVVYSSEIHPCEEYIQISSSKKKFGTETKHVNFDAPLLPYNGVEIWWAPVGFVKPNNEKKL